MKFSFSAFKSGCVTLLVLMILSFLPYALGQTPLLQITAPAGGTVVNPGTTLSVTVTSPANATFTQVAVIGEDPVGLSNVAATVPAQLSLAIPLDISCGQLMLTAEGNTTSGQSATSDPVFVDIERSDFPASLSSTLSGLVLSSQGEQLPLIILATFFDATVLDVSRSSYLTFASGNTNVATVDAHGVVTAVGPGTGSIKATYTLGGNAANVSIPVTFHQPSSNNGTSNFVISVTPGTQAVAAGTGTSFTVSSSSYTGFTGSVALSVSGLPSGASASLSPTSINVPGSSTLTVSTPQTTPVGTNVITITGVSGNLSPSAGVTLTVNAPGSGPTISTLSPTSGPVGTSVTIIGTNFGSSQGASSVTFNGTAATPTSWSATSIVAPVPSGATTGNVVVTVGGMASNGASFTVNSTSSPTFVQGASVDNTGSAVASTSVSFPSNTAQGDLIVVYVVPNQANMITVSDTAGNTFSAASSTFYSGTPCANIAQEFFYAANIKGGADTVTATLDGSYGLGVVIVEYSGIATASPLDAQAGTSSPTSCPWNATPTSASFTLGNTGDLIVSGAALNGNANWTPGTGYTLRTGQNLCFAVDDQVITSTGTYSGNFTTAANMNWVATAVAFKKAP